MTIIIRTSKYICTPIGTPMLEKTMSKIKRITMRCIFKKECTMHRWRDCITFICTLYIVAFYCFFHHPSSCFQYYLISLRNFLRNIYQPNCIENIWLAYCKGLYHRTYKWTNIEFKHLEWQCKWLDPKPTPQLNTTRTNPLKLSGHNLAMQNTQVSR